MARSKILPYTVAELPWRSGSRRRRLASVPYFAKAERIARNASCDSRLVIVERCGVAISTWLAGKEITASAEAL
ncbi:MAG: hypothetical protein ACREV7_16605 [Steroidobacteraceae bacterium]